MSARRKLQRTPEGNANRSKARRARLDPLVAQMYAYYRQGYSLKECGEKFGHPWTSVYSLFRVRGLARRRGQTPAQIARRAERRRAKLDPLIGQMHADYLQPMSLNAVGRKYGYDYRVVREFFVSRGLPVRTVQRMPQRDPATGKILPYVPFTDAQLAAMIAAETALHVPAALKLEWRTWSMERRGWFIAKLRARLNRPGDRPSGPFSSNVEPFDYTTPRAHEVAARMNAGTDSRTARVKVDICSQGVIWRDRLWFWASSTGYQSGPWMLAHGRPSLHKAIWEETHGRKMPRGHAIRFVDGNPNNLTPENLRLATRNDVLRENQAAALLRKSRERTAILLNRSQSQIRHALSDRILTPSR